jgi:RHS repeat-associated protein
MPITSLPRPLSLVPRALLVSALFLAVFVVTTYAQSSGPLDGFTPTALTPGAPAGSFPLSAFENVNPLNGALNVNIPLYHIGGRGTAGYTIQLPIEQKWHVVHSTVDDGNGGYYNFYDPDYSWWTFKPGYGPGLMTGRQVGVNYYWCATWGQSLPTSTLTRFTFTAADGTEYEFRDVLTDGTAQSMPACYLNGFNRKRVFKTADGTSATFISDYDIVDAQVVYSGIISADGYLLFKDGTRYRIDNGYVSWIRDRNGNKITFTNDGASILAGGGQPTLIKDSLNREVVIEYSINVTSGVEAPYGFHDKITYKGFGGQDRVIRVGYSTLDAALKPGYSVQSYHSLFPELSNSSYSLFNPTVVSTVWLPNDDSKRYRFYYNPYGEVARLELPTGGAFEYDYAGGISNGYASGALCYMYACYENGIYRRVIERRACTSSASCVAGGSLEGRTTFSRPESYVASPGYWTSAEYVQVDHWDNASPANRLSAERHYYDSIGMDGVLPGGDPTGFSSGARELKSESLDSDGTTVLRRVENTWRQPQPGTTWPAGPLGYVTKANDPQIVETVTTLADTNQVSRQTYSYDRYSNKTDTYEYDFGESPGTAGIQVRHTHVDYLTTNSLNGQDYACDPSSNCSNNFTLNNVIHIRNLVEQQFVYDGNGTLFAKSKYEYDNYSTSDNFHARLKDWPAEKGYPISGLDSSFTASTLYRGNPTSSMKYLVADNSITGSVVSYAQYDLAGQVVKTIDPRSTSSNIIATTYDYSDCFGSPDSEAQTNTSPSLLGGQRSYAFITSYTDAVGHVGFSQRDFYLGRVVNSMDSNGVVASASYDDVFDRPTKIIRDVNNTDLKNQTLFEYDDSQRTITTKTDLTTFNDPNPMKSVVVYDGLGRTVESRTFEDASKYTAVKVEYDSLGRPRRQSNPFRPLAPDNDPVLWTTTSYDALNRINSVTTPDSAVLETRYSGNRVLASDQVFTSDPNAIGNRRLSITNALGQLKEVWEVTPDDSTKYPDRETVPFSDFSNVTKGYKTSYNYDVLDNLTTVTQGTQSPRTFTYDSLKRLKTATNPESGTTFYTYDESGNLIVKTDSRGSSPHGVSTHFEYDNLGRIKRRWYNGSSALTDTTNNNPTLASNVACPPEVNYIYDSQGFPSLTPGVPTFSRGASIDRLVAVTYGTGSSSGDYFGYDDLGRVVTKTQQTGGVNYVINDVRYDRAGHMTFERYPSGRTFSVGFDGAGRTTSVSGTLGTDTSRTYSSGIVYTAMGGMTKEQLGTDTPIYNKLFYDVRGQLAEIRDSTTSATDTSFNRGAIINHYSDHCWGMCGGSNSTTAMTDNNGNLKKQDYYIPDSEQEPLPYHTYTDFFSYDALNRLQNVTESRSSNTEGLTQSFVQAYTYDRFGNRSINQSGTTQNAGINTTQAAVVANTNTNRMYGPGESETNHPLMDYDAAGNQTKDYYTTAGVNYDRLYDAENRMVSSTIDQFGNHTSTYTYDGGGARVKRNINGTETWQVYGFGGELLAEYAANGTATAPQKEYGYRNGQLLVIAASSSRQNVQWTNSVNVTVSSNNLTKAAGIAFGPNAGASSSQTITSGDGYFEFTVSETNKTRFIGFSNDDTDRNFGNMDFGFMVDQNRNLDVCENASCTLIGTYGAGYNTGDILRVAIEGGVVKYYRNSALVYTSPVAPTYPLLVDTSLWGTNSTLTNVVISGNLGAADFKWLVTDQLGTPRMIFDKSGSLANTKRHDYLPFGEELFAGTGSRTTPQGYSSNPNDGPVQKFTSKERDPETGLDYFLARYYASLQGRFTSADTFLSSGRPPDPRTWNRFAYAADNPLRYVDPLGLYIFDKGVSEDEMNQFDVALEKARADLEAYAKANGTKSKEYQQAAKALAAYGEKGVDNGVTVASQEGDGGGRVVGGRSIRVEFDPDEFKNADFGGLIIHEGSHAADKRIWIDSGFKESANPTMYQTEFDAYTVQGFLAQVQRPNQIWESRLPILPRSVPPGQQPGWYDRPQLWNPSWAAADITANRSKGVDEILSRPKNAGGLYELSPTDKAKAFHF